MNLANLLVFSFSIFILSSCSVGTIKYRVPSSIEGKADSKSCSSISTEFIKIDSANTELANITGLKYLTQKFSEIKHLDRSNLVAMLLRYRLVAQNNGKKIVDIPLSKLKAIHPIDRGASLEKTKARAANLSSYVDKHGTPELISTDIQEETIKSRMLMRAVKTDDDQYIVFDGNGRLFALREFAQDSKLRDIPISVEVYDIDFSKIKHLIEIRRKHLYQTGEDVSQARKKLYKPHISDTELNEMISSLKSEGKKYSRLKRIAAKREDSRVMEALANEIDVKVRQLENLKKWREFGYAPAYKEGFSEKQIELMANKEVPLGFTREQFEQAKNELAQALRAENIENGNLIVDGTSTSFYSNNPTKRLGKHFQNSGFGKSDIDFKVFSSAVTKHMREAKYHWGAHEDFFKSRWMESEFQAVKEFNKKWSKILGRKVTVIGVDREILDASQYGNFIIDLSNQ